MILISLVGEQPIPILLPALELQPTANLLVYTNLTEKVAKRVGRSLAQVRLEDLRVQPYDIEKMVARVQELLPVTDEEVCFNLTGGTKPMIMAAYQVAVQRGCTVYYLESERHRSTLYTYPTHAGAITAYQSQVIAGRLSIHDYLHAHLDEYTVEGFHRDAATGQLDAGGLFEKAVFQAVQAAGFEVMAGIRPGGVGKQLEIDLMMRKGNVFGIAEIKTGDRDGTSLKHGLDQLANVSGREYLGTYAERFLITGRIATSQVKALAQARKVHVIELPHYRSGLALGKVDSQRLELALREKFS